MFRVNRCVGLVIACALSLGCGGGPVQSEAERLAEIQREGRELDQAFDKLEDRFLADQARLDLWEELKVRHQHVSAVATANAEAHLVAMVRHAEHQEWKASELRRGRLLPRTVASASVGQELERAPASAAPEEGSAPAVGGGGL